ncbi:hypothetical protein EPR50_G00164700 [Perca flavescens]|uniref:C2H2-type domain-containing protein n=2 Tax=Perca flavescens TaxID=8167 RepID=A0A484CID2_PERFV|nr:hypothetical protein EPR50_G00164700 [Perca flavescens]
MQRGAHCFQIALAPDPERPPVLSVSQDWVPILDKVFGQKWCSDLWQIKERGGGGQDPRWTPLEDMEVFSPDDDAADGQRKSTAPPPPPGPPLSPKGSSGRRSSASMLHRLLTLPSQLLEEDDDEADAAANETLAALAIEGVGARRNGVEPLTGRPGLSPPATREEEEEEEEEDEDKGRKKKRRRVWSECEECGRRFSRMSLLKAHRQTHVADNAGAADTSSPSSPPGGGGASALCCSHCGKRFSSTTRLHSHVRTQHPGNRT